MLANEMELPLNPTRFLIKSRILGALAMFCAPMLLLFFMFGTIDSSAPKTFKDQIISLTGVFYIGGWIAGAVGMRRLRATGDGAGSKIVFIIQIALLSFALLFSVMEVFGYSYENGGLLFAIADAGYPLSHLFMIVVGIYVLRAKVWRGLPRIAPFIVGFALPSFLVLSLVVGTGVGGFGFGLLTATGLGIVGYTVFKQS